MINNLKKIIRWLNRRAKRIAASVLAAAYLFTNVIAAHAVESNIWAQRRAYSQQTPSGSQWKPSPAEPRSLPPTVDEPTQLAQLPSLEKNLLQNSIPAVLTEVVTPFPYPAALQGNLGLWLKSVPTKYADLGDIYLPSGWKSVDGLVFIVQDAHGNLGAQKNIAGIVESLSPADGAKPLLVGVEGAHGPLDFAPYRALPHKDITKDIADYFLRNTLVNGWEYVGLTTPNLPFFWGVEDARLYLDNVQILQDAFQLQPRVLELQKQLALDVQRRKEQTFNPALKELDDAITLYSQERISLAEYLGRLTSASSIDEYTQTGSTIRRFLEAQAIEESLDFQRVEEERLDLARELAQKLPAGELDNLRKANAAYKMKTVSDGDFYDYLRALCARHGVKLAKWREMDRYIRYVLLAESITGESLFEEIESLKARRLKTLSMTPQERELLTLCEDIRLLGTLFSLGFNPQEKKTYQARRQEIRRIPERMRGTAVPADFITLLAPFETFDDMAMLRD
ncbi:MAG: hypothetical protein HY548_02745, partial [Elusimicrobia bacterium]|nr:hypothetical protein [Elusimicrobiota bacterium]